MVQVFALDLVAQNSDENSAQKFRCNFRDYLGNINNYCGILDRVKCAMHSYKSEN